MLCVRRLLELSLAVRQLSKERLFHLLLSIPIFYKAQGLSADAYGGYQVFFPFLYEAYRWFYWLCF
jgi:hypothetical protein